MANIKNATEKGRSTKYSMCEWELILNLGVFVMLFLGAGRKRPEHMARRLEEERHGSWASTQKNPTGGSCSVAGASPTSFSQSVTPFPLGLWGCTLLPASLCPELLSGAPQLSRGAHLPHSPH